MLGGHGFLGRWLVRELVSEQVSVLVLDRTPAPSDATWSSVVGSVGEVDLAAILDDAGADVVFHLASPAFVPPSLVDPAGDLLASAGSTIALLEAVRHGSRRPLVVLMSSAAVYGTAKVQPMPEEHPLEPTSPYGVAKLASEEYLRLYHRAYGISGFAIRPFSLYGPGQRKLFVFDMLRRLLDGEDPLAIHGRADVTRDLLYARDAARSIVAMTSAAPGEGESYNLGSGRGVSLGELADAVIASLGLSVPVEFSGEVRPGDPLRWEADMGRAAEVGAVADTPLDAGLRETAEWVVQQLSPAEPG